MDRTKKLKYISEMICIFFEQARELNSPSKARMAHAWISEKQRIFNQYK